MDEQLTKSLTDLIDETLSELEELRKSKMSAAEIKLHDEKSIDGRNADGSIEGSKKAEDEEDEDEDEAEKAEWSAKKAEDDEEEDEEEDDEAKKSGDDPADSPETKRKLKRLLGKDEDGEEDEDEDEESMGKKEKKSKKEPHPEHEKKEKKIAKELLDMHKSVDEASTLMKSYVEERIQPLEKQLATILELVNSIAEQPVAPKGVTAKTAPLLKSSGSAEYGETLSKAEVANKLFELKKSGTRVDSLDIAKAEMGQDLANIVKKYEIS
jgi:hypothetical protein